MLDDDDDDDDDDDAKSPRNSAILQDLQGALEEMEEDVGWSLKMTRTKAKPTIDLQVLTCD